MQQPDNRTAYDFAATFIESATEKYTDDTLRNQTATLTPQGKKTLYDGLWMYAHTYEGTFEPMVKLRDFLRRTPGAKMSLGQCRMVANSLRVDLQQRARRDDLDAIFPPVEAAPKAAPVAPNLPVAEVVPDGYYTVVFEGDEGHVTLRVRHWNKAGKPEWVQIVSLLTGPENTADYTGIAFLEGKQVTFWKSFKGVRVARAVRSLVEGEDAWKAAGVAYALRSRKCFICNRELTDPLSVELGVGPICREQVGF